MIPPELYATDDKFVARALTAPGGVGGRWWLCRGCLPAEHRCSLRLFPETALCPAPDFTRDFHPWGRLDLPSLLQMFRSIILGNVTRVK